MGVEWNRTNTLLDLLELRGFYAGVSTPAHTYTATHTKDYTGYIYMILHVTREGGQQKNTVVCMTES